MISVILAAAAALQAAPAASSPASSMQMGQMQPGKAGQADDHQGMDCCKDCCKDMARKHEGHTGH